MPAEDDHPQSAPAAPSTIDCDACRSALESGGPQDVSVLLLDQLTVPLISCATHLEQFRSICGLSTEDTAELVPHRPAGGIRCPSCRLAPHNPMQAMIPVQDGAIAVMACPDHRTEIVNRFRTGIETRRDLTADLPGDTSL